MVAAGIFHRLAREHRVLHARMDRSEALPHRPPPPLLVVEPGLKVGQTAVVL